MKLHELKPAKGAVKAKRRLGRGTATGQGKTSGRGQKGQWSRSGGGVRVGFEGGQMPLARRLPKRGFTNIFKKIYSEVNVETLNKFEAGTVINAEMLKKAGTISKIEKDGLKILGNGALDKALTVQAAKFTASAKEKIEKINELIIHYTYDSIEEFLEKLNRYTSQSAKEYIKNGKNPNFIKIYSKMMFRFFRMYILQLGFMDGYEGYLLAKYSSIYTMTKYTKLREEYYNNLGNDTSLVITTYNWPKALEVCLNSVLDQTVAPKEIIVADDGSKQETIDLVKRFQESCPQSNIIHSWQEDKGFRAGMSRNRAISKASGNYIIIIDGDLMLNRHFVEDHIKNMQKECFIQGSRVITSPTVAKQMMEGKKINLFTKGLKNNMNMVRSKFLSKIFTKVDKNLRGIRSCNMSFFKEDLVKVNGFEEEIEGWGREDSELAVRLFNIGCKKKKLKFEALTCHLYHNENDRSRLKKNDEYLVEAIKSRKTMAKKGLDRYEGSNAGNN